VQREYDYYASVLGEARVTELHEKLKLAVFRMGRYNWYAASLESMGGPDTGEMVGVAFLFAAEALVSGEEDIHEAMKVGLREAVRLAQHDAAAYLYNGKDGYVQSRTILSDLSYDMQPAWSDDDGTSYYNQVEGDVDRDILRKQVSELLTGHERSVVLLLIDDPDSDEYGWKARAAEALGWSRETFNTRLKRGLDTIGSELYGRTTTT
jgi:hypothetical protein